MLIMKEENISLMESHPLLVQVFKLIQNAAKLSQVKLI